jgi:hypothetical protein
MAYRSVFLFVVGMVIPLVCQAGDDNLANIEQLGANGVAVQIQSGSRNQAYASQVGSFHGVTQTQSGSDNQATFTQAGIANPITRNSQYQEGTNDTAIANQTGFNNGIQQNQFAGTGGNLAMATQVQTVAGSGDVAVYQSQQGGDNIAVAVQTGLLVSSNIQQNQVNGSFRNESTALQEPILFSAGKNVFHSQSHFATDNFALTTQASGHGSLAVVNQDGSVLGTAEQAQDGNFLSSQIFQSDSTGNEAAHVQSGDDNVAHTTQQ